MKKKSIKLLRSCTYILASILLAGGACHTFFPNATQDELLFPLGTYEEYLQK